MRLHVHEWGDPDAPTVVCVHGVSAHGRRYPQAGGGAPRGALPRARARPARSRLVGVGAAVEPRDASGRSAPDPRARRAGDVGRPQLRRPAGAGARRAPAGAAHVRGAARPRDPDPAARRLRLRPGGRQGPRLRVAGRGDRRAPDAAASRPRARRSKRRRGSISASSPDGLLRWRYARGAVATMYSELCREPPPSTVLAGVPTLLVHAEQFGLVREDQLEEYPATLGDEPRARRRAGRPRRLLGRVRADRRRGREVPDSSQSRFTPVNRPPLR